MSHREIPEVVACPICQHTDWVDLAEGAPVRIVGVDSVDLFPIETNPFVCQRCGFIRLHITETH
jgi:uncharacterized protein YbaR (Trm112 family)